MWNNAINAWWPLLFYAATDAPRFGKGMIAMICTCVGTLGVTALVWWLERREVRARMKARREDGLTVAEEEKPKLQFRPVFVPKYVIRVPTLRL